MMKGDEYKVEIKGDTLTILGGTFTDCHLCNKRKEDESMEFHHTSYDDNEGIFVCGNCHTNIHIHGELAPDIKRKQAVGPVLSPTDYSIRVPFMPGMYSKCIRESDYYGISVDNLVRVCLESVIEYGDGSLVDGIKKVEEKLE